MKYIDLNKITDDHVQGNWIVEQRSGISKISDAFSQVHNIEIKSNLYKAKNGKEISGNLMVYREESIIYNPQVKFFANDQEIANAIITRLYTDAHGDKKQYRLTLYFTTGLELTLQKN